MERVSNRNLAWERYLALINSEDRPAIHIYKQLRSKIQAEIVTSWPEYLQEVQSAIQHGSSIEISAALNIVSLLNHKDRYMFFPDILPLIGDLRWSEQSMNIIRSLSREWLRENIEAAADRFLEHADELVYSQLFELYYHIDPKLASQLACQGLNHPNREVQILAMEYLTLQD